MIVKLLVDAAPVLHRICVGLPLAMGAMTLRSAFCAALAATLAVACGGNVDAPAEAARDETPLAVSTLLDDDGNAMPSDPRARPDDVQAIPPGVRFATAARPAETTPRAVLVSAAKTQQAAAVAQRLEALSVPLVWVVQP